MWIRNTDTGKWSLQVDQLPKDYYDGLKKDIQSVKLYSKCLSGAVYISIDNFDNIYNTLSIDKIGYFINNSDATINYPQRGDKLSLDDTNYETFYRKYLKENAFTIKNLFTPNKLIDDEVNNLVQVDVATTEEIFDITSTKRVLTIDGIRIIDGHRILVKNQVSEVTLASNVDAEDYFTNIQLVSQYYVIENNGLDITYSYFNKENGIYRYTNGLLIRESELDSYDKSYKFKVVVKYGIQNRDKEFHIDRLKSDYYPVDGDNVSFTEKQNYILRHRLDYNNVQDLNYYDLLQSNSTQVYSREENFTYSIPDRLIAVGEFGVIINNQDKLSPSSLNRNSNIINTKYKVNFRSISETNDWYWICGDEGTLLKVYKPNLAVTKIDLGIYFKLNCVKFYDNLNGFVVGEFNTIFYTSDGGDRWSKLNYSEYDPYSILKVIFIDANKVFVSGTNGLFLELTRDAGSWISYKRQISKLKDDENYILVDDIYDMFPITWATIKPLNYTNDTSSSNFAKSLEFRVSISEEQYQTARIEIFTKYKDLLNFKLSKYYITMTLKDSQGGTVYDDIGNPYSYFGGDTSYLLNNEFSFYQNSKTNVNTVKFIDLPKDANGKLIETIYTVDVEIYYNYNALANTTDINLNFENFSFKFETLGADLILLSSFNKVIVYDMENKIYTYGNDFIFMEFDKICNDIRTISKPNIFSDDKIYIGADKLYYFNFGEINRFTVEGENHVLAKLIDGPNIYVNRLTTTDKLYFVGNESLMKFIEFSDFATNNNNVSMWDPNFGLKYKSRFLFLDYDIGSKLNFFTDLGQYRLPQTAYINKTSLTASNAFLQFTNLPGETNWINYYRDAEQTFEYYSSPSDTNKIQFSTTFKLVNTIGNFTINSIGTTLSSIKDFAPSLTDSTKSEFIQDIIPILNSTAGLNTPQPTTLTPYDVLIYKNLIIFKRDYFDTIEVEDVLRIESDVVDCNLVVNKITYYYQQSSSQPFLLVTSPPAQLALGSIFEKYVYCYHSFNQTIVNNLKMNPSSIVVKNLNKYVRVDDLVDKFSLHPLSIGYKAEEIDQFLLINPRFNNNTAYYNLQTKFVTSVNQYSMLYKDTFLNFGFTPTYNIYDMLNKIDSNVFNSSKKFSILPEYYQLPGVTGSQFNDNNLKIEENTFKNKIYFGKKYKFHWETLLLHTFVDVVCINQLGASETSTRMLIISKYEDKSTNSYVVEFHKSLKYPDMSVGFATINIISRNTLSMISEDLQMLNNIQRTSTTKSIDGVNTFTTYQNEVKFKFTTDSYFKALVSDYDIQDRVTGIVYTDNDYQLSLNILNVEREIQFDFNAIINNNGKALFFVTRQIEDQIKIGDLIYIQLTGGTGSSQTVNPQYQGWQTVTDAQNSQITISLDYGIQTTKLETGTIKFIKKDNFLNYEPIDLYGVGSDKKPKRSIEIKPEMVKLNKTIFSLEGVNLNKFKIKFVDGLFLQEVEDKYSWFLQAETSDAVIGQNEKGLIWYSGIWRCGRWFGGTWVSGDWLGGDWYDGIWYSTIVKNDGLPTAINSNNLDDRYSKWYGGRWFNGSWYGGRWYDGRRYAGEWFGGTWFGGIWNDGSWFDGNFQGGIWVLGSWVGGKFNCDTRPSYWLDGNFESGDFENGVWYNGQFGNDNGRLSRFGTRSINTRISIWHGGKWISGEFHSVLNFDTVTQKPKVSENHSLSLWNTGIWLGGDFYGGIAYNIDFRGGTWQGGILDEIQVIGIDAVYPEDISNNRIWVNGIYKFNPGDDIYIVDDYRGGTFSSLGTNTKIGKYRVNKIYEDTTNNWTGLYLNYNLGNLDPKIEIATGFQDWIGIDTSLKVVSHFVESTWKSGYWTNGYFEEGTFESGIWYNGVFEGTWGN